ncbi:uncharacterized protein LOC115952118 [Quercus lobata]|uniref:uncharacterized protein LOC115952118 n=1 Tax=Quercus lobata TaxID=97700 RepID=UPI001248E3BF|nr:uncharacterized protein LOC115952118 [Quercus lobata]
MLASGLEEFISFKRRLVDPIEEFPLESPSLLFILFYHSHECGSLADRIEKSIEKFLWGGLGDEFKHHLVGVGGIGYALLLLMVGIRKLATFNQALLGKLLWRFGIEETHLWRRVVISKSSEEWGVKSAKPVLGIHGCGLWKSIRMGCQLYTLRLVLVTGFAFGIWHDCWCGDQSLRVVFLVLYDNFTDRDASMASLLVRSSMGKRQGWHFRFLQDFNDLELDLVASVLHLLESHIPITEDGDKVKWRLKKNEEFDIRFLYNAKGF